MCGLTMSSLEGFKQSKIYIFEENLEGDFSGESCAAKPIHHLAGVLRI